ncbi:MAG: hypothetical protein DRP76_01295 [Candidatus Omnitrophota bacterium]|nr:MAG: hypothetical protein DRP76_01295 [Candidatus Omnitrophota bacterium]
MCFYSHIDKDNNFKKELKEHLKNVGEEAKEIIKKLPIENKDFLSEIAYLIGISHDFGKYTSFFQKYLIDKKERKLSQHSFISALFTAWQVQRYIERFNSLQEVYSYLPLIGYFVVLHHHGDLGSIEKDTPSRKQLEKTFFYPDWEERFKIVSRQVNDLKKGERLGSIEEEYKEIVDIKIGDFLNSWQEVLKNLKSIRDKFENLESSEKKINIFLITLLLYSVLIDLDKRDAGGVSTIERKTLDSDLVDKYKEKKYNFSFQRLIDVIRNQIYDEVVKKIKEISLNNHLFTITAPTGCGKTLTAFSAALKLRERIEKEKDYTPRIIYSLPFITIIEQNYEVIHSVLSSEVEDFGENESVYLLKHHHLSDLKYKTAEENKPLDEALLLIESWQSEIIITTFVQLLHTMIGFKNSFLKKYHNIVGSIILLDEVQNIPIEYWDLTEKVIKVFSRYLGCYFILLTATKPLIFKKEEAIELVEGSQVYFKRLNRVVIKSDLEKKDIDEFIVWFKENYDHRKSYLIVTNTIGCSKEVYQKIKECNLCDNLFYLSTNIIPKQRAERIKIIKDFLEKNGKLIVVSTQVIEAGVDVDFDIVIRDIGPLDSIIQTTGRCNREFATTQKEAHIFCLNNFASYVYGKIHPDITRKLLRDQEIQESCFYEMISKYFEEVKPKINNDKSKYIWEAMLALRFYENNPPEKSSNKILVSEFQLIKETGEYVDIFVEIDEDAKNVWERYCKEVYQEKDFIKRKIKYLSIRKDFKNYIISVRKDKKTIFPTEVCGISYVPKGQLDDFYSMDTGFKGEVELVW